jgi:hypothetical protein
MDLGSDPRSGRMTGDAARIALLAGAIAAIAASGCGGDGSSDNGGSTAGIPQAVVVKANANCRYLRREARGIARGALTGYTPANALRLTTEHLVKPSIPLLARVAKRQQALEAAAGDSWFELYADLFDPIVVTAQERLSAGRENDYGKARELEEQLTSLGLEQKRAAREAGLRDCNVDFQHVLLHSLSG